MHIFNDSKSFQGGYPMHPSDNMQHPEHRQDEDADSTIIESASLYADNDGVAPLPGSEAWRAQQKLLSQQKSVQKSSARHTAPRDSDEYESEDEVKSNASEINMEGRDDDSDFNDYQNDNDETVEDFKDYSQDYNEDFDQDRNDLDSEEEGKLFTKSKLSRLKDDRQDRHSNDNFEGDESDRDDENFNKEDSFEAAGVSLSIKCYPW